MEPIAVVADLPYREEVVRAEDVVQQRSGPGEIVGMNGGERLVERQLEPAGLAEQHRCPRGWPDTPRREIALEHAE